MTLSVSVRIWCTGYSDTSNWSRELHDVQYALCADAIKTVLIPIFVIIFGANVALSITQTSVKPNRSYSTIRKAPGQSTASSVELMLEWSILPSPRLGRLFDSHGQMKYSIEPLVRSRKSATAVVSLTYTICGLSVEGNTVAH